METLPTYLDRKFQEIALLDSFLAFPLKAPKPGSPAMVIEQKFRLAAAIKAERLRGGGLTETARPPIASAACGPFRFRYEYQRADLRVQGPSVYPALSAPQAIAGAIIHRTVYTASGMSALAALFTALSRSRDALSRSRVALSRSRDAMQVLLPEACYSESRELLQSFGDRIEILAQLPRPSRPARNGAFRVILLDSSARAAVDIERLPLIGIDLLVFDTTCYGRSSGRLRRIANWALRANLPIALVRSHTKLDYLGTEYGRLGSIVIAAPLQGMLNKRTKWMTGFIDRIDDAVRLFGLAPTVASFPPFAGDRRYNDCSTARLAAIMRNNRRLARRLAEQLGSAQSISEYQHGLYLTLTPEQELSRTEARSAAAALCDELVPAGLPVLHAGSFGFDFIAIDAFVESQSGRRVIRIAASDIPTAVIDQVAERIGLWWQSRGHLSVNVRVNAIGATARHAALA